MGMSAISQSGRGYVGGGYASDRYAGKRARRMRNCSLVHALIRGRGMEVDRSRIAGKFELDAVLSVNLKRSSAKPTRSRNVYLLWSQRNVILLGMFDHQSANVIH